jgi:hypothetical protein
MPQEPPGDKPPGAPVVSIISAIFAGASRKPMEYAGFGAFSLGNSWIGGRLVADF